MKPDVSRSAPALSPLLCHAECPVGPDAPASASATFRMGYWQWGDELSPHVVLCVHGLTRQGRDFDVLARTLVAQAQKSGRSLRVVCPDVAGRGQSQWLPDPGLYQPANYVLHLQALVHQLHQEAPVHRLDWVGTSMGGLVGMLAAVQPQRWPVPLARLVLNDVGPVLDWTGLSRIGGYVGMTPTFDSLAAGLTALRERMAGFGPHTDEEWQALNTPMLKPAAGASDPSGQAMVLHYDPAIAQPFRAFTPEAHQQSSRIMSEVYAQIACPTLLLRGAESDLLARDAALAMTRQGPRPQLVEFQGVGHAPTLVAADQVQAVRDFLLQA